MAIICIEDPLEVDPCRKAKIRNSVDHDRNIDMRSKMSQGSSKRTLLNELVLIETVPSDSDCDENAERGLLLVKAYHWQHVGKHVYRLRTPLTANGPLAVDPLIPSRPNPLPLATTPGPVCEHVLVPAR